MVIRKLKLKYRTPGRLIRGGPPQHPEGGTMVYQAGKHTSTNNNSGKAQKARQGTGHRKKAYGPW